MNTPLAQRLALVLSSVAIALLAFEVAVRISNNALWHWSNLVLAARTVHTDRESARFVHDDQLGALPRPGYTAPGLSFDAQGLRRTGDPTTAASATPILAVGDSYTYGDEVGDDETWPAHLQRLIGRPVLNGGVSGFGFDQIVLYAERLAARDRPGAIVVSFIADDIQRTEMSRVWGAEKPYFALDGDGLALRNVPVPPRPPPAGQLEFWERTLGYSYLIDFVLRRLQLLHDWYGDHVRAQPPGTGELIACRLTGRLAALKAESGAKILLVAQYDPMVWRDPAFAAEQRRMTQGVLDCAQRHRLAALDTFEATAASTGPGGPGGLYELWHMNDAGNRLIAGLVAGALKNDAH